MCVCVGLLMDNSNIQLTDAIQTQLLLL